MKSQSLKIITSQPLLTLIKKSNFNNSVRIKFSKLFIFGLLLCFGMIANAQQTYWLDVNNTASTGCDWTVYVYDHAGNALDSVQVAAGTHYQGCRTTFSTPGFGTIDYLIVHRGGCFAQFGSLGTFSYTSYAPPCGGVTCSSSIDCSGFYGSPACGGSHLALLIQIQ